MLLQWLSWPRNSVHDVIVRHSLIIIREFQHSFIQSSGLPFIRRLTKAFRRNHEIQFFFYLVFESVHKSSCVWGCEVIMIGFVGFLVSISFLLATQQANRFMHAQLNVTEVEWIVLLLCLGLKLIFLRSFSRVFFRCLDCLRRKRLHHCEAIYKHQRHVLMKLD